VIWVGLVAALIGTICAAILIQPFLARYGRREFPFDPREQLRDPRSAFLGGGIAIAMGAPVGLLALGGDRDATTTTVVVIGLLFGSIGILDDVRHIGHGRKFTLLVFATAFAAVALSRLALVDPGEALVAAFVAMVFLNVFNFMDGVNGISALSAIVIGAAYAVVGVEHDLFALEAGGILVCATALGFLPFNFPVSRMYMNDSGTYVIGGLTGVLLGIALVEDIPAASLLLPWAVYFADTSTTLLRRMFRGVNWTESHREHVYQVLVELGWQHRRVVAVVVSATLVSAVMGRVIDMTDNRAVEVVALVIALSGVGAYMALPRLTRRRARAAGVT
jgi:UDP-GlcNAc:undecaprenyl-phosphate/decaprenyl-phosphate GlcNAc-1-phosphate transferase